MKDKNIYIVLSQSGTLISRILRLITKDKYNHVSISMQEDLSPMYSFARKGLYNPFVGGFVAETIYSGVLAKHPKTVAAIFRIAVTDEQFAKINHQIFSMKLIKDKYKYNFKGLFLGTLGYKCKRDCYYYCSEFVQMVLENAGINCHNKRTGVVRPMDLLAIKHEDVYEGNLHAYIQDKRKESVNSL